MAWALFVVFRTRRRLEAAIAVSASYLFGLEIASGFTIRSQGPQEPIIAILLVLIGPSGVPRGDLRGLPLGALVVRWPPVAHLLAAIVLAAPFLLLSRRTGRLRPESVEARRLDRAALALMLVAYFECLEAGAWFLPYFMSRDI